MKKKVPERVYLVRDGQTLATVSLFNGHRLISPEQAAQVELMAEHLDSLVHILDNVASQDEWRPSQMQRVMNLRSKAATSLSEYRRLNGK